MNERIVKCLYDIRYAIEEIDSYFHGGEKKYEDYISNILLKRAIERDLEIIGEASKQLSSELKSKHQEIPWKEMAGMRDKLIHDYFGVDIEVIWKTISVDIPNLKLQMELMIKIV